MVELPSDPLTRELITTVLAAMYKISQCPAIEHKRIEGENGIDQMWLQAHFRKCDVCKLSLRLIIGKIDWEVEGE